MSFEKRLWRRRRKNIFTIIAFTIIVYLLFSSFFTLFKRNIKTTLPESMVLTDSIYSQGFLIKKEYLVNSTNNGVMELIANEGERLAAGREVVTINTLKDKKSLEYELKEIEENISLLEKNETESDVIMEEDETEKNKEHLVLELQNKIISNEFNNIIFIKEQLILYDEKYNNMDLSKPFVGQSLESLKDRKNNILEELEQNHIKYYTNNPGVISYEIDGYEENYLPKNFEDYTYETLKVTDLSKIIRDEKSNVLINEPIFKIIDNFEWYMAIKIENPKDISSFNINDNIKIYINENEEELDGSILAINSSGEKSVVVARFNTMFHKYYDLRFPQVQIIKEKINGYKIPKKSIVSVDNMNGVYIKDRSGIVRFKPISIFKEDNNYVYIYSGDEKANIYLDNSSESVKTVDLFDEILISPNNIEEGDIL